MYGPTAQGIVPEDHFSESRFTLESPTLGIIPLVSIDERPNPTTKINAADRSIRTGGESEAQTINFRVPVSADAIRQQLLARVEAGKGLVQMGYREDMILTEYSVGGSAIRIETLRGAWISGHVAPALDKGPDAQGRDLVEAFELSYSKISVSFA